MLISTALLFDSNIRKIAVPPGGGGIVKNMIFCLIETAINKKGLTSPFHLQKCHTTRYH
jgi:hypothetical protein